jgi:methyl-accepting chemotaxis protein
MKLTLIKKMIIGFISIIVIFVIVSFVGIRGMQVIKEQMTSVTHELWPAADATMEMHISFLQKEFAHSSYLEGKLEEGKERWEEAEELFQDELVKLRKTGIVNETTLGKFSTLNAKLNRSGEEFIKIYQNTTGSESDKYLALLHSQAMKDFEKAADTMTPMFAELEQATIEGTNTAVSSSDRLLIKNRVTLFVFGIIALLAVIFIASVLLIGITRVVTQLSAAVSQITSSGNEIQAASQQQAAGAREQSAAVSETSSAAKELSQSAEQVGESTKRVSEVATHSLAGMSKIKDTMDETGKIITSLSEKSQKIGKITELIDDIADQTNLLAVNASIEAARAGEQGKGFTVVADEIRKLADSTAKSTKDITALVEIIQHEMSNAIMSMESSVTSVNEESKLAQESAERAKEISMSTNQQISGSKQIADAMGNIDEAMKQIAAGAQQTQTAVTQLTQLGTELKQLTELLK